MILMFASVPDFLGQVLVKVLESQVMFGEFIILVSSNIVEDAELVEAP